MSRETTLGKKYGMNDEELPWVYARSEESGGIFGLKWQSLLSAVNAGRLASVAYAPNTYRTMHTANVIGGLTPIEYVTSLGDGSSHGATWRHFADLTRGVSEPQVFRKLDDRSLELQLDGMLNMALEGANRHDGGWTVIHEGLVDARDDVLEGKGWRQEQLYVGLGWMATNFAEREEAAMPLVA